MSDDIYAFALNKSFENPSNSFIYDNDNEPAKDNQEKEKHANEIGLKEEDEMDKNIDNNSEGKNKKKENESKSVSESDQMFLNKKKNPADDINSILKNEENSLSDKMEKEEDDYGYKIILLNEGENGMMEDFIKDKNNESTIADIFNFNLDEEKWIKIVNHSILMHYEKQMIRYKLYMENQMKIMNNVNNMNKMNNIPMNNNVNK